MVNDRFYPMLSLRIPPELRRRLEEIAKREDRAVSDVARRALELGLAEIELTGFTHGSARERGDAFERAVVKILMAYGLLEGIGKSLEREEEPKKHAGRKKMSG